MEPIKLGRVSHRPKPDWVAPDGTGHYAEPTITLCQWCGEPCNAGDVLCADCKRRVTLRAVPHEVAA